MATAQADVLRGQLAANLHPRQLDALQGLVAGIAEHHLEAQALADLGADLGHRGITRQQQALGCTDAQVQQVAVTFDPGAVIAIRQQAPGAIGQRHFADQPALASQCAFKLAQVGLDVAVGRQVLHQHVEDAAAGQADRRVGVAAIAIAHELHRLGEGAGGQAFEEVILHAAAGQRADPVAGRIGRQQGARRAGRRAIGGQYGAEPHRLAGTRPFQGLAHHQQIKVLHGKTRRQWDWTSPRNSATCSGVTSLSRPPQVWRR
ncbi:hypothetical protein FQZ97_470730 [compost metagenome]